MKTARQAYREMLRIREIRRMTESKKQKVAQVERLRAEGKSLSEIAAIMGVSKSRIRDHIQAGEWQRAYEKSNDWLVRSGFSVRLCNSLCNAGIGSRKQLLRAVKTGKLNPRPGGTRNYGYKSHAEILKWLGLPVVEAPSLARRLAGVSYDFARTLGLWALSPARKQKALTELTRLLAKEIHDWRRPEWLRS